MNTAKDANVNRFLFVSFRRTPGITSPLGNAKEQIEEAVKGFELYRHPGQLVYGSMAESGSGIRLCEGRGPRA